VPRDVLAVDKLPMLAAGKIDYPAVQRLAESKSERAETVA
jgi:acyl-coenzyme A synthetase/AMP-(fatty) acid ligase